jgi:hypothetical protein
MAKRTKRIKLPEGTDEVNYGDTRYTVDPVTHEVELPAKAAEGVLDRGGAIEVDDDFPPLPQGVAYVRHPSDPNASCSFGGETYAPDAKGLIIVPNAVATEFLAHGFELVETHVAEPVEPEAEAEIEPEAEAAEATPAVEG